MDLLDLLPTEWRDVMKPHVDLDVVARLSSFVEAEYAAGPVYPPHDDLFSAFRLCTPAQTRVLILGQDPYHKPGQAHGLSFSVRPGVAIPPSLRNIYKELQDDLGVKPPLNGDLTPWARQGVLMLNAVLTVRGGQPTSHADKGWEHFTDAAIKAVNDSPYRVVFVLWGAYARKKAALVRNSHHVVLEAGHPSPMNPRGFLGCRHFSQIEAALKEAGRGSVTWS
ncbi:MAG TPA: uracil-DNA glycosylase [Micromonosporaceae bacterium]|nr:uracil-DNA glycosylase [Micromonosporaceae bacterium]